MRKYNDMEDLLSRQRRRRGRRRGLLRILLLAILAATVGYYWLYVRDRDESRKKTELRAVQHVQSLVHASLDAAHRPLEVDAPEKPADSRDEALSATWKKGETVTMRGKLAKNQSVFVALESRNLLPAKIQKVVSATSEEFEFRRSRPGDTWFAEVDESGNITRFRYQTSPEDIWETVRNSNGSYSCTKVDVPVERRRTTLAGQVDGSLWQAIVDESEKPELVYRFADIFAYSVDFNRETQPGDTFAMIVEKVYLEGEFLRYGKILAAEYVNQGEEFRGFLYETEDEEKGYYDEKGKNLKRQFLKSPLASIRVTSRFGMRYHPVVGQRKMHRGVDYGAPRGTPIRAVADGTVSYAGRKGANGNLVVLRHANGYVTLYAHLSDISNGIRPGKKVTKKTVIGKVGSTGRSTGPHLHFGMKRHGKYVNPMKVEFARAEPLEGEEKEAYKEEIVKPLVETLDAVNVGAPTDDSVNLAESAANPEEG